MTELSFLDVSNFVLQKGGFLPEVRMAYRTVGTLNAARDNAVLVPSWYAGTAADSETYLVGKDRALDPATHFIILTNLLSQLWTWEKGDISNNPLYGGDYGAALRAIKARTIIMPVDLDRYFPPQDALFEAEHIQNAECRIIRSDWGHMAPMNPKDAPAIDAALRELLEG